MNYIAGFLGAGNMGGALARAVSRTGCGPIAACDRDTGKVEALAAECGAAAVDAATLARDCTFIYIGVKPQVYAAALAELAPVLSTRVAGDFVLVSMGAGVTSADVETMLGFPCPVIRIMPNTPVSVGMGVTVYTPNAGVTDAQIKTFCDIMQKSGTLYRIAEEQMNAAMAISGCGPAFVYLFAEALGRAGESIGLSPDLAAALAAGTVRGAGEMLQRFGDPVPLRVAVCSPGGTTIEGVEVLEAGNIRALAGAAVTASYEKASKMKK